MEKCILNLKPRNKMVGTLDFVPAILYFSTKITFAFVVLFISLSSHAQVLQNTIVVPKTEKKEINKLENFSAFYFYKFLGPSLSSDNPSGTTFNRFKTGQDMFGKDTDYRGAYQSFHSLSLGYKFNNKYSLNFMHSYQYDESHNVEYRQNNFDGSSTKMRRQSGTSFNNNRLNLQVNNLYSNNTFFIYSIFYIEQPSNRVSRDQNDMQYGAGISPTLAFYSNTPGLFTGFNFSFERDVYPDNEFYPDWCKQDPYTCDGVITTKRQTTRVIVAPYLTYIINDKFSLFNQLSFDWDQDGDQEGTGEFNNNMDDIISTTLNMRIQRNLTLGTGLEASITRADLKRTSLFAQAVLSF